MTTKSEPPAIPPVAEKRPLLETRHGIERVDDYAWLRAGNWLEVVREPSLLAPDIRAHLEAENAFTAACLDQTQDLQETLFDEMKGRIKEDDSSPPAPDGPFAYYTKFVTGGQHPLFCRSPREGGPEEVLIDGNALAKDHAYFRIGGVAQAPAHDLIAYASDTKGSEYYDLRVFDAASGAAKGASIPDTAGGCVWANDGCTLFYTRVDENHRPRQVYRHTLGSDPKEDELVYEETATGFFVGVGQTQSRKYITIDAHDHQTSEIRLIDADQPTSEPVLVERRARPATNIRSSIWASTSSSSPTAPAPKTSRSSRPPSARQASPTGATSNPTARAA